MGFDACNHNSGYVINQFYFNKKTLRKQIKIFRHLFTNLREKMMTKYERKKLHQQHNVCETKITNP